MNRINGELKWGETAPSPGIDCYIPKDNPNGIGIIIFPGGGYGGLSEHEGKGYAEYFCASGIASFVVTYRLGSNGHRHPAMLEDTCVPLANSMLFATAFRDYGVPFELHVYAKGGHGLGLNTSFTWAADCMRWVEDITQQ